MLLRKTAKVENRDTAPADFAETKHEQVEETQPEVSHAEPEVSGPSVEHEEARETDFSFSESVPEEVYETGSPFAEPVEAEPAMAETHEEAVSEFETSPVEEEVTAFEPVAEFESDQEAGEVIYDSGDSMEAEVERSPFDSAADFEPVVSGGGVQQVIGAGACRRSFARSRWPPTPERAHCRSADRRSRRRTKAAQ